MLEAERQFRRIIGYRDLAKLAVAVERQLTRPEPNHVTTEQAAIVATSRQSHPDRRRSSTLAGTSSSAVREVLCAQGHSATRPGQRID
jgi:hypothetical protein